MKNSLKEKIQAGTQPIGIFYEMGDCNVAEVMAFSDLDYIVIDAEHGPYGVESALQIIKGYELQGDGIGLVRVKDCQSASISKMLDIGAKGIIVPRINTVEEVQQVVEAGKYYPVGNRGLGFGRGSGYGYAEHAKGTIQEYFQECNDKTLIIPQCETKGCLDNIEKIVEIDGVDGIFIGPLDLSVALGIPLEFENSIFVEALEKIKKVTREAGKFIIIYCPNLEAGKLRIQQGYDSVAVGTDVDVYMKALNDLVVEVNNVKDK